MLNCIGVKRVSGKFSFTQRFIGMLNYIAVNSTEVGFTSLPLNLILSIKQRVHNGLLKRRR